MRMLLICAAKSGLCSHNLFLHFDRKMKGLFCSFRGYPEHNGTVWQQTVPFFLRNTERRNVYVSDQSRSFDIQL